MLGIAKIIKMGVFLEVHRDRALPRVNILTVSTLQWAMGSVCSGRTVAMSLTNVASSRIPPLLHNVGQLQPPS